MKMDFSILVSTFHANAQGFEKAIEGVPVEQWLVQPTANSNHLAWIAGHLVVMRALVPKMLGVEWSAPWERLFARGAKLVSPQQYPQPSEVREAWKEVSEKLTISLASITDEMLSRSLSQETPSLDGKIGGSIALLSLHETYHVGQLGYLRKLLGHGQAMG